MRRAMLGAVSGSLMLVFGFAFGRSFLEPNKASERDASSRPARASRAVVSRGHETSSTDVRREQRRTLASSSAATAAPRRVALVPSRAGSNEAPRGSPRPYEAPAGWKDEEEPDRDATDELTQYFAEAMSELSIDGAIDDLTCRRTLCRVNAHFADVDQALKFESAAGMVERRRAFNFTVTDGVIDVEVFLARE